MRWKVFFGLSLAFLSGLFLTQSSFAASQSYSYSAADGNYPTAYYEYTAANVGFNFSYVTVDAHTSTSNSRSTRCYSVSNGSLGVDSGLVYVQNNAFSLAYTNSYFMLASTCGSDTMTLTFYDYNPLIAEPCPECPPVPDLPYGEKLDNLTNAVIIVAATMLVLYFFFAIYNMFFKGLK